MNFLSDLSYALRTMRRNIRFTALTVAVMTIGLSLCIFMFSFIYNTLEVPLAYDQGERIRLVENTDVNWGGFRIHDFEEMAASQDSFEIFDTFAGFGGTFSLGDQVYQESGFEVGPKFFEMTQAKATMGRIFTDSDTAPGAPKVVIISEKMWRASFSADPDIIGQTLEMESIPYQVIGVLPYLRFPNSGNIWLPMDASSKGVARADGEMISVYGRLKPGVTAERARTDLAAILDNARANYPKLNANVIAKVITFQQNWMPLPVNMILPMQICVVLILFLSSINVGNLLFSRALERKKEIAIRAALGATRSSLFSHVLMESMIICLVSGVLALVLANIGIGVSLELLSKSYKASEAPVWWQFSLTPGAIGLGMLVALVTAVLTGVLPAIKSAYTDINSALRDGTKGAQSKMAGYLSKAIIILEVSLSCALLIPSAALIYTVHDKNTMSYGASMDGFFTALLEVDGDQYDTSVKRLNYLHNFETILEQRPEITAVTFTQMLPLTWVNYRQFALEDTDVGADGKYPRAEVASVANDYFETVGVRLLTGRKFDDRDKANSPRVAVVTQNFVDQQFSDGEYLGKKVRIVDGDGNTDWHTVIGMVNDVIHGAPSSKAIERPTIFLSMEQNAVDFLTVVMESNHPPSELTGIVAQAAYKIDPVNVAPFRFATSERLKERRLAFIDFLSVVFLAFAVASMVLAFSGIYGVMANSILQKTQEVGVRRALGSTNGEVFRHFLKQGGWQLLLGVLIGLPSGVALNYSLNQSGLGEMYYGVFVVIPLLIALIILMAVVVPVSRTLKYEPIDALRYE
ncbi:MAG: putative ABC transport system permease protein [Phenylobacterium sp.]|jgi:putative ABC transport system permease protein